MVSAFGIQILLKLQGSASTNLEPVVACAFVPRTSRIHPQKLLLSQRFVSKLEGSMSGISETISQP